MGSFEEDYDGELYREDELGVGNSEDAVSETPSDSKEENIDASDSTVEDEVEDEASLAKSYTVDLGDLELYVDEDDDDSSVSSDVLTSEEKMHIFADKILSCCVGGKPINRYALDRLTTVANPRLFRDENYIIFSVLYAYRSKLKKIKIDEEFLRLFLNRNRGLLQKSRSYIDIGAYGEVDGSSELAYIGGVVKHYTRLCGMEELDEQDFETYFEKYKIEFKAIEASKIYSKAAIILTEGLTVGHKRLFGFEDSYNWSRRQLADIEGLVDTDKGTGYVRMNEVLRNERDDTKKPVKIADFDRLTALNDIYGGIFTSTFYQVLAPPKAGKTKFCERVCHTAIVKYGTNVTVWAQEGGMEAWTAQMRAIHFDYTYNTGKDVTEKKYGIDQKVIMYDQYPSQELRDLELSSKRDLESNPAYGSVDFIDRPFEVETFLDDIDASVKENGSQLVIIDYLQLIGSANSNKSERERVAEAYRQALTYCKNKNIALFTPGQFKQEVINELLKMGDSSGADTRTSGGTSAEVIRTPDIIFTLWASTQDLQNNVMKILSTPARMSKAFPDIHVVHDLAVCQFISVDK